QLVFCFFFQAEDGIRDFHVTGVQTCALPIYLLAILLGATYLILVGPLRRLFPESTPVRPVQKIWFLGGLIIGYFALGSPLNLLRSEERRVGKECRSRGWPEQGETSQCRRWRT